MFCCYGYSVCSPLVVFFLYQYKKYSKQSLFYIKKNQDVKKLHLNAFIHSNVGHIVMLFNIPSSVLYYNTKILKRYDSINLIISISKNLHHIVPIPNLHFVERESHSFHFMCREATQMENGNHFCPLPTSS